MNWRSIGGQLEVNRRSIGGQLEVNWKSIGGQLEVNRGSIGGQLEVNWTITFSSWPRGHISEENITRALFPELQR